MQIHNNRGELIGEINVIIRPAGGVTTTNTRTYQAVGVDDLRETASHSELRIA
jgi:hypothetical protein